MKYHLVFQLLSTTCFFAARTNAQQLLDARAPLSAMTTPGHFYFLEVPTSTTDGGAAHANNNNSSFNMAKCGDGSPFSFIFKRGSDQDLAKVVVEFLGTGIDGDERRFRTPWSGEESGTGGGFPLGTCKGIPQGFMKRSAPNQLEPIDDTNLPIGIRSTNYTLGHLDGIASSWSYLLVPDCTQDFHIGLRKDQMYRNGNGRGRGVYHRGGYNAQAVMDWLYDNFRQLDTLVVTGCGTGATVAPAIFATQASSHYSNNEGNHHPIRQSYVLMDSPIHTLPDAFVVSSAGLANWEPWELLPNAVINKNTTTTAATDDDGNTILQIEMEGLVRQHPDVQFGVFGTQSDATVESLWAQLSAIIGGGGGGGPTANQRTALRNQWLTRMKQQYDNFHFFFPEGDTHCEFAFSESIQNDPPPSWINGFQNWIRNVTAPSSSSSSSSSSSDVEAAESQTKHNGSSERFRPTFLAIAVFAFLGFCTMWMVWYVIKEVRLRQGNENPPPTPMDLWLMALTQAPGCFLVVSLLIPSLFSYLGFAASGNEIAVNLDFDSYLKIDSYLVEFGEAYDAAQTAQLDSFFEEEQNCQVLKNPREDDPGPRWLVSAVEKGEKLEIFYQSRHGSNVFTAEVLQEIKAFEESIRAFEGWEDVCYKYWLETPDCVLFDSVVNWFYNDDDTLKDIESVLYFFLKSTTTLEYADNYFSSTNLASNFTRTSIRLRKDLQGSGKASAFLEKLHHELLWPADQNKPYKYPNMVFSWANDGLAEVEAYDALIHDAYWSGGTLAVVGILILFKIRNVFVFLMAMAGLVLAFPSAFYWYYVHVDVNELTLLNVASLFVMLGIGADDIFLMVDTYSQTKVLLGSDAAPAERMKMAYRKAGSTMLVSSTTTAVCFYSNIFSVLLVVREFGIFMGTVVVLNYFHVMTILPSAILVNDMYLLPFLRSRKKNRSVDEVSSFQTSDETPVASSDVSKKEEASRLEMDAGEVRRQMTSESAPTTDDSDAKIVDVEAAVTLSDWGKKEEASRSDMDTGEVQQMTSESTPAMEESDAKIVGDDTFSPVRDVENAVTFSDESKKEEASRLARSESTPTTEDSDPKIVRDDNFLPVHAADAVALSDASQENEATRSAMDTAEVLQMTSALNPAMEERDTKIFGDGICSSVHDEEGGDESDSVLSLQQEGEEEEDAKKDGTIDAERDGCTIDGEQIMTSENSTGSSRHEATEADVQLLDYDPFALSVHNGISEMGDAQGIQQQREGGEDEPEDNPTSVRSTSSMGTKEIATTSVIDTGIMLDDVSEMTRPSAKTEVKRPSEDSSSLSLCDGEERGNAGSGDTEPQEYPMDIKLMGRVDRWFVSRYAPFIYRRRWLVLLLSIVATIILGALGYTHFAVSDGTIILFQENYNLGRVASITDTYLKHYTDFASELTYEDPESPTTQPPPKSPTNVPPTVSPSTNANASPTSNASSNAPRPTSVPIAFPTKFPTPFHTERPTEMPGPVPISNPAPVSSPPKSPTTVPISSSEAPTSAPQVSAPVSQPTAPQVSTPVSQPTAPQVSTPISQPTAPQVSTPIGQPTAPQVSTPIGQPTVSLCPKPCGDGGVCDSLTLTCLCAEGFSGETCEVPTCANGRGYECDPKTGQCIWFWGLCSNQGQCRVHPSVEGGTVCDCDEGYGGIDCSTQLEAFLLQKETFEVSIVWGIEPADEGTSLWNRNKHKRSEDGVSYQQSFDLSEPEVQSWLLEVCKSARKRPELNVRDDLLTWIEILEDYAMKNGLGFPVPKELFAGSIQLLRDQSRKFRSSFKDEIGTSGPGLGGDLLFASVTMLAEVSDSEAHPFRAALKDWTEFVEERNGDAPDTAGLAVVQSDAFTDAYREDEILSTTLSTWLVANSVCLAIILLFTQNVSLSLIVMVTMVIIFICVMGLLFAVFSFPFGPIQAIGVTIFIGLSANYSLHIVHAYHSTSSRHREEKIQRTIFATASPITASAVSTIAACAFLLGCRVWLFVELGAMLCSNTAMALVFSMLFLLAVLAVIGPLPCEGKEGLHQCDARALISCASSQRREQSARLHL